VPKPGDIYEVLLPNLTRGPATLVSLERDAQGGYWIAKAGSSRVEVSTSHLFVKLGKGEVPRVPKAKPAPKAAKKAAKKKVVKKAPARKKAPPRKKAPAKKVVKRAPAKKALASKKAPKHRAGSGKRRWVEEEILVRTSEGWRPWAALVLYPRRWFARHPTPEFDPETVPLGYGLTHVPSGMSFVQTQGGPRIATRLKDAAIELEDSGFDWSGDEWPRRREDAAAKIVLPILGKHGLNRRNLYHGNPPLFQETKSYRGTALATPEHLAGKRSVLGGRRKVYQFHPAGRGGAREFAKAARRLGNVEHVGLEENVDPHGRVVPVVYVDLERDDYTFKSVLTRMACKRGGWDEEPGV
jgi:hypothetical protein